eukprot:2972765-Heterocapsa_arctica.AAC.1
MTTTTTSRTFLWMFRVLRNFRRRSTSPENREEERPYERGSNGYQADIMFPGRLLAWNYRQTRCSRLNSWTAKHPRRLFA